MTGGTTDVNLADEYGGDEEIMLLFPSFRVCCVTQLLLALLFFWSLFNLFSDSPKRPVYLPQRRCCSSSSSVSRDDTNNQIKNHELRKMHPSSIRELRVRGAWRRLIGTRMQQGPSLYLITTVGRILEQSSGSASYLTPPISLLPCRVCMDNVPWVLPVVRGFCGLSDSAVVAVVIVSAVSVVGVADTQDASE